MDMWIRGVVMRAAKFHELRTAAFPVLTAKVSGTELATWFPVKFEEITDPKATPEPSKGALLKLARGPHFVLYWGEFSNQLTVEIPGTTNASAFLVAFFREVPLPKSRVLWHRPDATMPNQNTSRGGR